MRVYEIAGNRSIDLTERRERIYEDRSLHWQVRVTLEEWVNLGRYGRLRFADGSAMVFRPSSVSCKANKAGVPIWITVGLSWDEQTRTETYAYAQVAAIVSAEDLEQQPLTD